MKLSDAAQAAARVALVADKPRTELEKLLAKWFAAQFIKGIKLPLLRSVYQGGAYPAFAQLLAEASDADRLTVLDKLDKHRPDLRMRSKAEILKHIEDLGAARITPSDKPKGAKASGGKSAKKGRVGIISDSKY